MTIRVLQILFLLAFLTTEAINANNCDDLNDLLSVVKESGYEAILEIDLAAQDVYGDPLYTACRDDTLKGVIAYSLALKYFNLKSGDPSENLLARKYFEEALRWRSDSLEMDEHADDVIKCKINIGRCYYYSNQLGEAREIMESCFALKDRMESKKTIGRMLFHLGEIYLEMGVFDRAADCFEEVIELTNEGEESLFYYMVHAYNLKGIALSENAEYETAYESFSTFGNEFLPEDEIDFIYYLKNSAICLDRSNQNELALEMFESMEDKLRTDFTEDILGVDLHSNEMCHCLLGQTRALTKMDLLDEARQRIQVAAKYCEPGLLDFNDNLADVYYRDQQLTTALKYYHTALLNGFGNISLAASGKELPDIKNDRPDPMQLRNLLEVTQAYGSTAYQQFQLYGDPFFLNKAYEAYELYDQLFLLNFEQLLTDNSRYRLIETSRSAFEEAIMVSHQLYNNTGEKELKYAERAFYFAERIRANLLFTSISNKDALDEKLIPDKAKVQVENILVEIRLTDEQLSSTEDQVSLDSLIDIMDDLEIRLDYEKGLLADQYPAYFQLAFSNRELPAFDDLRIQVIKEDRAMVEYFVSGTEAAIYIIGIGHRSSFFKRVDFDEDTRKIVFEYLRSISDQDYIFDKDSDAWPVYFHHSNALYDLLLKDVLSVLTHKGGELIIIPDDILSLIPFATLLSGPGEDFYSAPYLLRDYAISYDYSAKSLLRNFRQSEQQKSYTTCGFAPSYDNNPDWNELLYNSQEVHALSSIFDRTRIFEGAKASRQAFEDNCSVCDILHISAHGNLDEEETLNNHLVFYRTDELTPEILTVSRIHLQDLQSRLTVLSSCNTAMGTLKSNEGLISVSNAFSYAGSRSVMASLWLLNDKQAFNMMENFYQLIKEGSSTAYAISEAQRQVAKSSPVNSHPYFWGNLMLIGNTDPLYQPASKIKYLPVIGGVVILLLFGLYTRRRKRTA